MKQFSVYISFLIGCYSIFHIFHHEKVFESDFNVYESSVPDSVLAKFKHIKFSEVSNEFGIFDLEDNLELVKKSLKANRDVYDIVTKNLFKNDSVYQNYAHIIDEYVFEHKPLNVDSDRLREKLNINFKKNSLIIKNLIKKNKALAVNPWEDGTKNLPNAAVPFPSVSIVDINKDGFMDIFIPGPKGFTNKLFLNQQGKGFKDVARDYGISEINLSSRSSQGYFIDFNLDGHLDLLLTRWGCHDYYIGQGPNKSFIKASENLDGYCSMSRGVNFIDFNKDGFLDIIFGNYANIQDINKVQWDMDGIFLGNKVGGGENIILAGSKTGKFTVRNDLNFNGWRSLTHAVGIMDFNQDGWDDIFFTNDYSTDEVWINQKGRGFIDETETYFPKYKHGFSGMNSEITDIDNDGIFEIYISNAYKPPFKDSLNNFWKKTKNSDQDYKQVSDELGIGRCGFAWGSKFADVDNNGESELLVVNGRSGHTKEIGKKLNSFWYYVYENTLIPTFLRPYRGNQVTSFLNYSSHERNCLFVKDNEKGKYFDIALDAGFKDLLDGRGLVKFDFDNNGLVDWSIANFSWTEGRKTLVYQNQSQSVGNWIGFNLVNKSLTQNLIGSKIMLKLEDGSAYYQIYNPFFGYMGQSDPRLHFGLGQKKAISVQIKLPDEQLIEFKSIKMNQYNEIII